MQSDGPQLPRLFAPALVFEIGVGLFALLLGFAFGTPPLADLRVDLDGLLHGGVATLPLLLVFAVTWRRPFGPFRTIRAKIERFLVPGFRDCSVSELALVSIAAGLGEEMLFRGLVQGALVPVTGDAAAVVLAGLAFGAAHAITPGYAVVAAVVGVYFGWLYHATGNLFGPVVCHALYDFVALWVYTRLTPPPSPR